MNINEAWRKALNNTEIIRSRVKSLTTFGDTHVPYLLLSESSINVGDTVVRKGEITVEKPSIILPPNIPQFDGFDFGRDDYLGQDSVLNFLLVRGISLPSMKYNNKTSSLDIHEGDLDHAVSFYKDQLQKKEDVTTGLLVGPEDCWQLSVLIFVCSQIARNAATDIQNLLKEYRKSKE